MATSMSDLLKRIQKVADAPLIPNSVAVPEMPELFEPNEPHLLYIARLTAEEKEDFESAYETFRTEQNIPEKSVKAFRSFAIAFCLCNDSNGLACTTPMKLTETALAIQQFPNNIVARIFTVADATNAFFKVDEATAKKSVEPEKKPKSDAGSGVTRVTSDTQAGEPG